MGERAHPGTRSRCPRFGPRAGRLTILLWAVALRELHSALNELRSSCRKMPRFLALSANRSESDLADADCTAGTVRPITLMQTSARLFALRANHSLAEIESRSVAVQQQGFVIGQHIDECMVGLDGTMTAASLNAGEQAMAILFGFANAFLSLTHAW